MQNVLVKLIAQRAREIEAKLIMIQESMPSWN